MVADEGSGDNTVAVAIMLRRQIREIAVLHAQPKAAGFREACQRARGRVVISPSARTDAPLGAVGYALGRLREGSTSSRSAVVTSCAGVPAPGAPSMRSPAAAIPGYRAPLSFVARAPSGSPVQ